MNRTSAKVESVATSEPWECIPAGVGPGLQNLEAAHRTGRVARSDCDATDHEAEPCGDGRQAARPDGGGAVPECGCSASCSARFAHLIERTDGGCWLWLGARQPNGYGRVKVEGRALMAHRAVYEDARGAVADGLDLDHLCRNRACVNPDHLEPVTRRTNMLRGAHPSAVSYRTGRCHKGHEKAPGEECRACWRERKRRQRAARGTAPRAPEVSR